MTRGTTRAHIARATLEGIACQVADVVNAMRKDSGFPIATLRVDGGACASDLLIQTQADLLGCVVERPANIESTARGAALLAGLAAGLWQRTGDSTFAIERRFSPQWSEAERSLKLQTWSRAVERAAQWESNP
jgi:glycerol kinase